MVHLLERRRTESVKRKKATVHLFTIGRQEVITEKEEESQKCEGVVFMLVFRENI